MKQKDNLEETIRKLFTNQQKAINKRFEELPEAVESLVRQVIREEAITKDEFEEKIKHLPTKDEFYESQAKLMKEVKDMREEQSAHMGLHDRIDKRFVRIEKHLHLANR